MFNSILIRNFRDTCSFYMGVYALVCLTAVVDTLAPTQIKINKLTDYISALWAALLLRKKTTNTVVYCGYNDVDITDIYRQFIKKQCRHTTTNFTTWCRQFEIGTTKVNIITFKTGELRHSIVDFVGSAELTTGERLVFNSLDPELLPSTKL